MNAEDRASELMIMRVKDLPSLARKYAGFLYIQYGMCGEVLYTAYAHYAQAVEQLKSTDKAYKIDRAGRKWFRENS